MPPRKNKSLTETGLSDKTIKVKKLDSVKHINKDEDVLEHDPELEIVNVPKASSKDSIIKSNVQIVEPIIELVENEPSITKSTSIDTIDKPIIKVKKNILKNKIIVKPQAQDIEKDVKISTTHTIDDEDAIADDNKDDIDNDIDNADDIEYPVKHTAKYVKVNETMKTSKEQKKDKVHNHSKPKTIIASTNDVNTVDMFGEDDLDFRYVMMNYDYTKNVTMPKITKYERALLIGKRAKQIEEGANPNVKYISGQSVVSIAEEELRQRKIPLIIKRPIGNKFEYWKPADMEVNMD